MLFSARSCLFISDNVWLVDMDPQSLVPPHVEVGGEAISACVDVSGASSDGVNQSSLVSVQGRLKKCISFWEIELDPSEFVLGIIRSALCQTPTRCMYEQSLLCTRECNICL